MHRAPWKRRPPPIRASEGRREERGSHRLDVTKASARAPGCLCRTRPAPGRIAREVRRHLLRRTSVGITSTVDAQRPFPKDYLLSSYAIHRSAWKGYSPKSTCRILHSSGPKESETAGSVDPKQ